MCDVQRDIQCDIQRDIHGANFGFCIFMELLYVLGGSLT